MAAEYVPNPLPKLEWGVIPAPVYRLMTVLAAKSSGLANQNDPADWPSADSPQDFADFFAEQLRLSHSSAQAAIDFRSLVTAYAHKFHNPRPLLNSLASAQQSTPQGLIRRYNSKTVDALRQILSSEPDAGVIAAGFPSLTTDEINELIGTVSVNSAGLKID